MIDHYVITRFNVRHLEWSGTYSDGWMESRIDLFKKTCLPSMISQTEKNFRWLIFFDMERTRAYGRFLAELGELPFASVEFAESLVDVPKVVLEKYGSGAKRLLTTRIDNDDVVHRNFIGEIQSVALDCAHRGILGSAAIDFSVECLLQVRGDHDLYCRMSNATSPFVSLLESAQMGRRTVLGSSHHEIGRSAKLTLNISKPYTISIAHGENLYNGRQIQLQSFKSMIGSLVRRRRHAWTKVSRRKKKIILSGFSHIEFESIF